MKLVDLEPRYFVNTEGGHPVGISFDCPCCVGSGLRLAIAIHLDGTNLDPDPGNPQQVPTGEQVWSITGGESFDDLTLSPSIDASNAGHWHGHILSGRISGGIKENPNA